LGFHLLATQFSWSGNLAPMGAIVPPEKFCPGLYLPFFFSWALFGMVSMYSYSTAWELYGHVQRFCIGALCLISWNSVFLARCGPVLWGRGHTLYQRFAILPLIVSGLLHIKADTVRYHLPLNEAWQIGPLTSYANSGKLSTRGKCPC